jgi:hypothetical protein
MARTLWKIEVRHEGLNKHCFIRGYDKEIVERKVEAQIAAWNKLWEARKRSEEASEVIKVIENTLKHTLEVNDIIDLELLKDNSIFTKPEPDKPTLISVPEPPKETDTKYHPGKDFLDFTFPSRKQKKINYAKLQFRNDYERWKE